MKLVSPYTTGIDEVSFILRLMEDVKRANTNLCINVMDTFEVFKSNICHEVKDIGQIEFIRKLLVSDDIQKYFDKGWQLEALYLLGMLDYLSRINDLPLCSKYSDLRKCKFAETIYPTGVLLLSEVTKNSDYKKHALEKAIPEFLRFNIVESEIENVA